MERVVPPAQRSDQSLWLEAASGDSSAFGELFERHADRVYNHCFRRTASWDAAQEATATVFLEAWRRRDEVVFTTASVLPWLLAVANNVVRHRWRSEVRYRQLLERLPMPTASADHADEVATRLDAERDMASVLEALADLAPEDQDVLSLCLWSQLSYADAAAALDVPVGTVRSRLSRARVRLNERIAARAEVTNGRTEEKSP